jgi:CRISPR-associated exonuclease Cas4
MEGRTKKTKEDGEDREDNSTMEIESEFLMISAIQHILYCERQFALIHVEHVWEENRFTVKGKAMHEKAHSGETTFLDGVRIERGLALRSDRLGLVGKSDVVEFRMNADGSTAPFPVEYKSGRPKFSLCDEAQLCAQAMCLEEMLDVSVPRGALFYGKTKRRENIEFDEGLRNATLNAIDKAKRMIEDGATPSPEYDAGKCDACSLIDICFPKALKRASEYIAKVIDETTS